LKQLHVIDDDFVAFLQNKVDTSVDFEERTGLASLLDMINKVLSKVREAQGDDDVNVRDEELTIDQVKTRMQELQMGQQLGQQSNTPEQKILAGTKDFTIQASKRDTFLGVLDRFINLPSSITLDTAVEANYDLCDYEFIQSLQAEILACKEEGADIEA